VNPVEAFFHGIAPQHVPALVAGLLAAVWLTMATRGAPAARIPAAPGAAGVPGVPEAQWVVRRWAGVLLGVSAAAHLALPLMPHHGPLVSGAFVLSGAGFAFAALRALRGRTWRLPAALVTTATLVGYLVAVARGEEADQVGLATALVELVALGLALVPPSPASPNPASPNPASPNPASPSTAHADTAYAGAAYPGGPAVAVRPRRLARSAGSTATVLATFLTGAVVWIASFQAHATMPTVAGADVASADATGGATDSGAGADGHGHTHEHAGRTQAGVMMRPLGDGHHATDEHRRAADALAARVRAATARFADLDAARAAGYRVPKKATGTDVHLEHKEYGSDGVTLDPERPEMLVYAIEDGRATLLGVVFVMERAGVPGPEPGGPLTRWHAHNVCLSALPPGMGVVSPFGSCPAFSVSVLSPEMMHVWVVENPTNPGGPFADALDQTWVRAYHATHGRPV
jgi:hypothetical protein